MEPPSFIASNIFKPLYTCTVDITHVQASFSSFNVFHVLHLCKPGFTMRGKGGILVKMLARDLAAKYEMSLILFFV